MKFFGIFAVVVLTILFFSCSPKKDKDQSAVDVSTQEMVKELSLIANDKSNIQMWHLNKERAQHIDKQVKLEQNTIKKIGLLFRSGIEWLNAGNYDFAIERLSALLLLIEKNNIKVPEQQLYPVKEVLGIAYLRKGEIENCLQYHNEYSCIIPIEKDGIHIEKIGAQKASGIFLNLLNSSYYTTQTVWLYNIAQMALGNYPDNIEKKFLVDPTIFKSESSLLRFTDMAMQLGVAVNDISGSVIIDDYNNDNLLDMFVSSYGLDDQLYYFENSRTGKFIDKTNEAGLNGLFSGLNMIQADYDNDGWLDLFVLRGAWLGKDGKHPNSLLRNLGNGTFKDVTKISGLYNHFPTQTACWADFNNDGWLDLFIGNEHSKSINAPTQLFENNKDGTFTNKALEKKAQINAFIKGCNCSDYNNDGYTDIYISNINGDNYLLKNSGPTNNYSFTNATQEAGVKDPQKSFPTWFFDYNQDGWQDIFVSGFDFDQFESAAGEVLKDYMNLQVEAELPILYENNKDGTFSDVTLTTKLNKVLYTMGCNYGDLNNDGFPDFYAATGTPDFRALIPNRMFLNNSGNIFDDVTTTGGFGHLQKGHGVAFGDIDMDGDQDIYTVLGGSYDGDNFMNCLFINPGTQNHWIKVKLIGNKSNKSAIGARIKFSVTDKTGKKQDFFNTVSSGASFGANPLLIEQGLGHYSTIDKIEITWPSSLVQSLTNVETNTFIQIIEGNNAYETIDIKKIELSNSSHHSH